MYVNVTLYVNGLNNPIKRGKMLSKVKKEKAEIIYLQETHLSEIEHGKLKNFGFSNTFYSSFRGGSKKGVAILISNRIKFECLKEIKDKNGTYVMVRGELEEQMVTLFNIYPPPESDKSFYKNVFDLVSRETEGILICGGDWNVVLNSILDSTSSKRNSKTHLSRYINTNFKELGIIDVWRECHPLERDYTFYSAPHSVHTRIDYFFMNVEDRFRIIECRIGSAGISDHCSLYLTLDINRRIRNTTWRLNVGMLNDLKLVDNLKKDKYL